MRTDEIALNAAAAISWALNLMHQVSQCPDEARALLQLKGDLEAVHRQVNALSLIDDGGVILVPEALVREVVRGLQNIVQGIDDFLADRADIGEVRGAARLALERIEGHGAD